MCNQSNLQLAAQFLAVFIYSLVEYHFGKTSKGSLMGWVSHLIKTYVWGMILKIFTKENKNENSSDSERRS